MAVSQLVTLWIGTYNKGTLVGSSSKVDTLPFCGLRGKEWVSKLVWLELRTKLLGSAMALGDRLLHDKNTFWLYKDTLSRHAIGSLHWAEQTITVVGVRQQKCIIWYSVSTNPVSCAICILYWQVSFYTRFTFLKKVTQIEHKNSNLRQWTSWGVRGLKTSCKYSGLTTTSIRVYDNTTNGLTDLYSIYVLYTQYIYNSIQYTYVSMQYTYLFLIQ
jgi:hypothetical protein